MNAQKLIWRSGLVVLAVVAIAYHGSGYYHLTLGPLEPRVDFHRRWEEQQAILTGATLAANELMD